MHSNINLSFQISLSSSTAYVRGFWGWQSGLSISTAKEVCRYIMEEKGMRRRRVCGLVEPIKNEVQEYGRITTRIGGGKR